MPRFLAVLLAPLVALLLTACGSGSDAGSRPPPTLVIGGIPDQDVALLQERFGGLADYLSQKLGFPVRYQPSTDYAALVTAFSHGDVQLGWFGGLTGVQARLETPGAHAVAQRPIDTAFRSVFVAGRGVRATGLTDLAGTRFTFGSESSTSGHLMPRYFLDKAGVDPDTDFDCRPGYSGSHDKTWKLVEAGSFQSGALSATAWDKAVKDHQVDTTKVREVFRTPPYVDYHWVAHPDLDTVYGAGTKDRVVQVLLGMDEDGPQARHILDLFDDSAFIATDDSRYGAIEQVARDLGLIGG